MEQREIDLTVAKRVSDAVTASGVTLDTLSEAADMDGSVLRSRLHGDSGFTVTELARVGGFLRIHPSQFLTGVAA
jgi:hypothetical protein